MYTSFAARFASALAACAAVSLLTLPSAAHAQTTYFPNNTTINSANPVAGNAEVGYANQTDYSSRTNPTSPTVNLVSGGSVSGDLEADNSSIVNISGGSVGKGLFAYNSTIINFSSGSVSDFVAAINSSVVNISGNSVISGSGLSKGLYAYDSSTVNISGGSMSFVDAIRNSTINISGGSVSGSLEADNSGTINLFGTGLIAPLVDPNAFSGSYSQYSLSGTLSDGTLLVNKILFVQNGTGARFTLNNTPVAVPEPGSVALLLGLTMVGASLLRRRRARK